MSFVKDDHKYTRGVGAIASMDAGSSKRRRAAALGAVEMARRDAIMARHTLGRIAQIDPGDGGGGGGGGGGAPPRPTPPRPRPPGKPLPPKPVPPRGKVPVKLPIRDYAILPTKGTLVKSPGSVIEPLKVVDPLPPPSTPVSPPVKPQVNIVVGPPVAYPSGGGPKTAPMPPSMPQFDEMPSVDLTVEEPTVTPPAKKSSGNLLVYALIGAGALWFLTRKH